MVFDPTDPHTWLIGPLPILVSIASLYQYGRVLLGVSKLDNDRMLSIWGLSAGIALFPAWVLGYRVPSELRLETVILFCAIMAALMTVLGFLVARKSKFGRTHFLKLSNLPRSTLIARLVKALAMFGGFLLVIWLAELIYSPGPCTRLNCRTGELLFGSRDSFFPRLWIYIMMGGLALSAASTMLYLAITAKKQGA